MHFTKASTNGYPSVPLDISTLFVHKLYAKAYVQNPLVILYTFVEEFFFHSLRLLRYRDWHFSCTEVDSNIFGGAYERFWGGLNGVRAYILPLPMLWNSCVSTNPRQRPCFLCWIAALMNAIDGVALGYLRWNNVPNALILFRTARIGQ